MIESSAINTIAAKEGLRSQLIELDYVLSWILLLIPDVPEIKRDWVFKGGTALRKIYFPNWRYSEDLDFTVIGTYRTEKIEENLNELARRLTDRTGISLHIKDSDVFKSIGAVKSIKVPLSYVGPLRKTARPRFFSLDLTFDELIVDPPERLVIKTNYLDQADIKESALVYSLNEILTEKTRSLLQRREPRDLYDVWRLLKEHTHELNLFELPQNFRRKCVHRKIKGVGLKDIFKDRAMKILERQWETRLNHQMLNLPPFGKVARETKRLIKEHLNIE